MPKIVVSDSSPLINLYLINRFNLLKLFFHTITIPPAVWEELTKAEEKEGVEFFKQERKEGFIVVQPVAPDPLLELLHKSLDEGEAEAIFLALSVKADLLLLDEKEGRSIARVYKIPLTGVIGILMRARLEGKISSLKKELNLLGEKGFWISDELREEVLQFCNEK